MAVALSLAAGEGCASTPISKGGVADLRRLILRTLNENQILILSSLAEQRGTITSLLRSLSEENGVPLSTLKLNARILRGLNLISFGSTGENRCAEVEALGSFVLRLLGYEPIEDAIQRTS